MRDKISEILTKTLPQGAVFSVTVPDHEELGHYSTNAALRLAKEQITNNYEQATVKLSPIEVAQDLVKKIKEEAPVGLFSKIEAAPPGFVNFWITDEALRKEFDELQKDDRHDVPRIFDRKRVMVEYTDPNPFKQFHIGHLMTNVIGEAIARLHEATGAEVLRVNYQGDIGLHVAKSIWGIMKFQNEMPAESASLQDKAAFLGTAYAEGAKAYDNPDIKKEIDELNKKIYERSDEKINELYDRGRKWSLDYFETLYARLGTKFNHYFFESEAGPDGLAIVKAHPDVFVESEGAIIFRGEDHGLHSRVFVNAQGLPTYEAKELGLNKKKFEEYHPDLSLIVTGNEINEYFRVLLKAMELVVSEAAAKTKHVGHGMLRLPTGKMSSRTGDVITAERLIEEVKRAVAEKIKDRAELTVSEREDVIEGVALAAIRYSILKQGTGKDTIFDIETSIAFHGDSGPYLQYTYARLMSILHKAENKDVGHADLKHLETPEELAIMRKMIEFPYAVEYATRDLSPNTIALYLYELADLSNRYYESTPILSSRSASSSGGKDEDSDREKARLLLVQAVTNILKSGLGILGIRVLQKI